MKTALPRSAPVLLMFVLLALAGRAFGDNAQEIMGRWDFLQARHGSTIFKALEEEKGLITEFRKDGTFTDGLKSGTYRFLNDTLLRLTFIENGKKGGSKEYKIRITGDLMVIKNTDRAKLDPETTYRRAK